MTADLPDEEILSLNIWKNSIDHLRLWIGKKN